MTRRRHRSRRPRETSGPAGPGRVPMILMYHAVADTRYDPNMLAVSPGQFAEQLAWLNRLGLRGVAVGTLVDALRAGRRAAWSGSRSTTGTSAVLANAVPELLRHGFTATVFVISDRLGGTNDWDEGTPWPLLSGRRSVSSPRQAWRSARTAPRTSRLAEAARQPAGGRGRRQQGDPAPALGRRDPRLRLPLWRHGRDDAARGP